MTEQKDRPELTDWIYNALKEIEAEEDIRLSDNAFIADHLAPKLQALIPDIEEAKREERERIIRWLRDNCYIRADTGNRIITREKWQALKEEK